MSARGIILFMLVVSLFIGCENSEVSDVLPKDKLAAVYSDMVFAKELYSANPPKYKIARDSILASHSTDTSQIRISFSWYAKDPEALQEIYNMAIDRAENRSKVDTATVAADSSGV